jgi:hypothetical protein
MKTSKKELFGIFSKLAVAPLVFCAIAQSSFAVPSDEPIGSAFSYKLVGDIINGNLHCDIGTNVETVPATLEDLDKITGSSFEKSVRVYALKKGHHPSSIDITGSGRAIEEIRKSHPQMAITGVVKHTKVKSCQITDVPKSQVASTGKQLEVLYETTYVGYVGVIERTGRPHQFYVYTIKNILNDSGVGSNIETTFKKDI